MGGYIFITVPSYNFLWSKEDTKVGHFRRYTLKNLESKLKDVGFEIEYSTYLFSLLPLPIFLFRSIGEKLYSKNEVKNIQRTQKVHNKKSIFDKLLSKVWALEIKKIKEGKKIPFGSSCFIVAKKQG